MFTGRFNALSEPNLVVNIIFILRAGSKHRGAGIVKISTAATVVRVAASYGGGQKRVGLYGGETNECGTNEAGTLDDGDDEETGG